MIPRFIKEHQLERKRQSLLEKTDPDSPLHHYLKQPLPSLDTPVEEISWLAMDFETTGFDAHHEAILSVGFTVIDDMQVKVGESGHQVIKINREIPEKSIVVHGITHDRMDQGMHLHDVMDALFPKMQNRVLLVHYQKIEWSFLQAFCKRQFGFEIPMRMADTLEIEKRYREKRSMGFTPNQLRLFNLRNAYGLPRYRAHNAMLDAIATAELFLAQMSRRQRLQLGDII